jgi:flagellar basal-body rod protein FlgF
MSTYGLWSAAAGMKVNEHRQTLLANNMANAETAGFKYDLAVIRQRSVQSQASATGFPYRHDVLDGLPGGVNVRPTHHNFAQGSIETTGRPLDVAISGAGFFTVSDGETTRYTRDGRFTPNAAGELVLVAGDGRWRVLDENGQPIRIDPEGEAVSVSGDGTIRQGGEPIASISVRDVLDKQTLRKKGENLFEATGAAPQPINPSLLPESLERSNYEVMTGLVAMIEATRAYEMNATLLRLHDQTSGEAINTVGRLA